MTGATRYVYLDTETTGLYPHQGHRITEIACVEVINGQRTGAEFHTYLNPQRELDPKAAEITGLSWEKLHNEPLFASVADEFLCFINEAILVMHNAPFDLRFLNSELRRCHLEPLRNGVIDTLKLACLCNPPRCRSLDYLCRKYGVKNRRAQGVHGAMEDTEMLIGVHTGLMQDIERLSSGCVYQWYC